MGRKRIEAHARARQALLWAAVAFAAMQGLLLTALALSPTLRDPEYGLRLAALRERLAERPGRPLVVVLGSSQVGVNLRPGLMECNRSTDPEGPVVFNFGRCHATPTMELLCLRRLLNDGVRPHTVVAEIWPAVLAFPCGERQLVQEQRLRYRDLAVIEPYFEDPAGLRWRWHANHAVPSYSLRRPLFDLCRPSWVSPAERQGAGWEELDGWGWLGRQALDGSRGDQAVRVAAIRKEARRIGEASTRFVVSAVSREAIRELAETCRREQVRLVLVAMPNPVRPYCPAAYRAEEDEALRDLCAENGLDMVDARDWAPVEAFADTAHLTHAGAAEFTRRWEKELRPYLPGSGLQARLRRP